MNNFVIGLKRFFTNKNVVTVIAVLVMLGLLYWGYSSSIKKQTNPVTIPVAAKTINQKTKITGEDIVYQTVANSMVGNDVIRNANSIIGKYTTINVTIPAGSMFYSDWLTDEDKLPGSWIEQLDYEKEELGYYMSVSAEETMGNVILPNTYVDMYMRASDENGTLMFGKLLSNVKILVAHDNSGNDAFVNGTDIKTPSKLGFAVSKDLFILLKKAEYLGIDLVIVPRGSTVPEKDYIIVRSSVLRDYIDAQTITVEEDLVAEEEQPTENTEATENIQNTAEVVE